MPFSMRRAAGDRMAHYFRWVALRPGPKVDVDHPPFRPGRRRADRRPPLPACSITDPSRCTSSSTGAGAARGPSTSGMTAARPSPSTPRAWWPRSSTAWHPSASTRRHPRTAMPPSAGWWSTPKNSAWTRPRSPSAASRPGATWRRWRVSWPGTARARRSPSKCWTSRPRTSPSRTPRSQISARATGSPGGDIEMYREAYLGEPGPGHRALRLAVARPGPLGAAARPR